MKSGVAPLRAGQGTSFLLRRLHSLTGVVPIGAFLLEHFISNAEAFKGPLAYGRQVEFLNSLPGVFLMELFFIWIPILYHGLYGVYIWYQGDTNVIDYPWSGNWLYSAQRWTGIIAFIYIGQHTYYLRFTGVHLATHPMQSFAKVQAEFQNPWMVVFYWIGIIAASWPVAVRCEVGYYNRCKGPAPLWLSLPRACSRFDITRWSQHERIFPNAAAALGLEFGFGQYRNALEIHGFGGSGPSLADGICTAWQHPRLS
jgi:succinate dehydrogenase/fumarate reductase cytochrome b subunit (b558 family)